MTTESGRAAMIARVRALLAKAERTDYPAEAEALFAKAAELMDKYRIAMAEVRDRDTKIGSVGLDLKGIKYRRAAVMLLGAVCVHYGVVHVARKTGNTERIGLIGEESDVEAVKMMFGSLLIQRDRACLTVPVPPGENTTAFRNSFAYGYAFRIHARLTELRDYAKAAASRDGNSTALEVYGRHEKMLDLLGNPKGVNHNDQELDAAGVIHGDMAARTADLGQDRIESTGPRAIGA